MPARTRRVSFNARGKQQKLQMRAGKQPGARGTMMIIATPSDSLNPLYKSAEDNPPRVLFISSRPRVLGTVRGVADTTYLFQPALAVRTLRYWAISPVPTLPTSVRATGSSPREAFPARKRRNLSRSETDFQHLFAQVSCPLRLWRPLRFRLNLANTACCFQYRGDAFYIGGQRNVVNGSQQDGPLHKQSSAD